jgi:putative ABC transport system permease protein
VQLIGFDPDHDFTITPWLESGLQRPLGKDEVIVGGGISGDPGSELMFYGHNFTIAGRLEVTGMGLDTSVFMRIDDAFTMAEESGLKAVQKLDIRPGQVSSFLVRVDDHADPNEVGNLIQAQISGTRVITPHQLVATVNSHLSQILKTLYLIAVILILISLPLAGTIAFLSARERQRDMGLIIAMGGSTVFVFMLVLMETFILAVAGGLIGIAFSSILLYAFQDYIAFSLEIPFLWPSIDQIFLYGVIPLLVAIGIGVIAALYPAIKSSNIDPFEKIWRGR